MSAEARVNPWLDRLHFHWAHQGGAREAPSNTIYSMERSLKEGADGLEFDVHRTKDNRIVLMHDTTLGRTTNCLELGMPARTRIRDCELGQLGRLDAAYWWVNGQVDDHDAPESAYELRGAVQGDPTLGVPTMDEVLRRFHVPYTIEVKDRRAVQEAADLVIGLLEEHQVPADRVIVTAFRGRTVRCLRRRIARSNSKFGVAPGALSTLLFFVRSRRGVAWKHCPHVAVQVPIKFSLELFPPCVQLLGRFLPRKWREFTVVDDRFVAYAAASGVAIHVWTINRETEMRDLKLRVHGVMTDCPSELTRVFAE